VTPALTQLTTLYLTSFYAFLNTYLNYQKIIYAIFIILMVAIYFFIWVPYLGNLSVKLWRTKGMLNMIPMEIIKESPSLKEHFSSQSLLQSVKWSSIFSLFIKILFDFFDFVLFCYFSIFMNELRLIRS